MINTVLIVLCTSVIAYLHHDFFSVQLHANRYRVRQQRELVHRPLVDGNRKRLPVYL